MKSGINEIECSRKMVSGRRVVGAIRSLVNASGLQLECARVLHESLLMPVLMYGSETMINEERTRIRAVQMDNFRGLPGIRRIDKVLNARIMELIKRGGALVVNWIWRLCNMAFKSSVLPEDRRSAVIVPLYKVKEKGQSVRIIEVLGY